MLVCFFFHFLSYSYHVPEGDTFQLYMRAEFKTEETNSIEYFYRSPFSQKLLFPRKCKFNIKLDIQHNL